MRESTVSTRWTAALSPIKPPRWAYTPGRRLAFLFVECWAALIAQGVSVAVDADSYAYVLIQLTALATGAFLVHRLLRKPAEERLQEELERDITVLERLRLSPQSTEKEKVRRYHRYLSQAEQARSGVNCLPPAVDAISLSRRPGS